MEDFAKLTGNLIASYCILYPILYFGYNFLVANLDMAEYKIPGFWIGMLGFLLFNITRNILFP